MALSIYDQHPYLLDVDWLNAFDLERGYTFDSELNPAGVLGQLDVAVMLIRAEGNLSIVASALRKSRRAVENFVGRDPMLRDLQDDLWQEHLDAVEHSLLMLAKGGDGPSQRFFLTTRGKSRGYTTRVEQTGKDGGPIETETVNRDAEDFLAMIARLQKSVKPEG